MTLSQPRYIERRYTMMMVFITVVFFIPSVFINWQEQKKAEALRKPISPPANSEGCDNIKLTVGDCQKYELHDKPVTQQFPLQVVTASEGSGGRWLQWIGSIGGYVPQSTQHRAKGFEFANLGNADGKTTNKLFYLHIGLEYTLSPTDLNMIARAALLLRHPFDVAYEVYTRKCMILNGIEETPTSQLMQTLMDRLIDRATDKLSSDWQNFLMTSTVQWQEHAKYWLSEYNKPLIVMLYNEVKEKTAGEVERMQKFFGYNLDGPNIGRHCCVIADSATHHLMQGEESMNEIKEKVYNKHLDLLAKIEEAIKPVQLLLDTKYPNGGYRISRG